MKAFAALALSACLGSAFAAPLPASVSFQETANYDVNNGDGTPFANVFASLLTLDTPAWVTGQLVSFDNELLEVHSVALHQVGTSVFVNWTMGTPEFGQWSLPSVHLDAGDWSLEVSGVSYMEKGDEGYSGSLTAIPEPISASLAALGLGLVGLTRRRAA